MTAGMRICVRCDKPIKGIAVVVPQVFATSGARPNDFRHDDGDPDCTARRNPLLLKPNRPRR